MGRIAWGFEKGGGGRGVVDASSDSKVEDNTTTQPLTVLANESMTNLARLDFGNIQEASRASQQRPSRKSQLGDGLEAPLVQSSSAILQTGASI